jgi:hypothetical protein
MVLSSYKAGIFYKAEDPDANLRLCLSRFSMCRKMTRKGKDFQLLSRTRKKLVFR